jgi:nitrogen regulatory protein P-II 1
MKLIRAIIREERLPFVQKALATQEVYGMTIGQVQGRGLQHGVHLQFRGGILNIDLLPKISVDIIVKDERVETVCAAACLGKQGDGRIFVLPVLESYRIRTGDVEA